MRIVGVDPSTKSGIVILEEGGTPTPKLLQFKDLRGFNRLKALSTSFDNLLRDHQPDLVVIEGYAYGNRYTLS